MANENRKKAIVNQINRLKGQIDTKKADILNLKVKPNSRNNNSYKNSIESLQKQIMNLKTQIARLKSELDKL